ncbi:MAG: RagB/SusD family nutrient uptake outer membrane protein [Tannerellaceae bacterium]|jgi:hypothetical protein|nr:RagB/SusD family nutrient uptake outer membrane protein [Tannerellaceae bacterium]
MKRKKLISVCLVCTCLLLLNGCTDDFLDFTPKDKITSANFPEDESDIKLLLNGLYAQLREKEVYIQGLFGFGILDGATPNAFNWGNTTIARAGNGSLTSGNSEMLTYRWQRPYGIVSRANNLLKEIEKVELAEDVKALYVGEAHFLRGLAYATLVESYGGVPLILEEISAEESRRLSRATAGETWNQVHADYDMAIARLKADAPETGRATLGAALGMKMRAYLYQGNYQEVLETVEKIDALGKYGLFESYEGLFNGKNENNKEVLFDIQYIEGENSQGTFIDQYCGTGTGSWTRGSRYVPTDDLVNAYEMADGSAVNPDNPYEGRDPRLGFTVVLPGTFILGHQFPNYIYPGGAFNHAGNRLKHLSTRKYRVQNEEELPTAGQSYLNNIVIRYADVLLSKAEAIIETGGKVDEAVALMNRIRTEREDVKITPLPNGLSREEARARLRNERRVEFALEGLYWMDIRRWKIGKDIYPVNVYDHNGDIIETKFPNGYLEHYDLLPIPDSERSLNENLEQNPGW